MTAKQMGALAAVSLLAAAIGCSQRPARQSTALSADDVALANRAVGLMGQFDYDQAREAFARLAAAHPERSEIQIDLAIATLNRQQDGDAAEARRILEAVIASNPRDVRAHYCLGLLLLHDGNARDAVGHFRIAAERDATDAYAAYFVAQCLAQEGDFEGALRWYERALAANPRLRSAAYGAFRALQQLGRTADADRMLQTFRDLETNPQSEVVEFKYTRMGRLAEVLTLDQQNRSPAPRPAGPAFDQAPTPLVVATSAASWRRFDAANPASITAADIDGDGQIDVFIAGAVEDRGATKNAVLLHTGESGFSLHLEHPLAAVTGVTAALWGDYDNDGLTDVYLCRRGANQLWRQTAKGSWADVTASTRTAGGGGTTIDGALFDADHDGDLDVLLIKSDGTNDLLNNNGDGTFRSIGTRVGLTRGPSIGLVLADLDADRDADIIVINRATPHQVLINDRTWQYHRGAAFDGFAHANMSAAVAADLDADGRTELYTSGTDGLTRWTRGASGTWEPRLIPQTGGVAGARQLAVADIDGDGRPEIIATGSDGGWQALDVPPDGNVSTKFAASSPALAGWIPAVLDPTRGPSVVAVPSDSSGPPIVWRPGTGRFAYVAIEPSGQDRNGGRLRSNRSGIGTRIAARTDSRWTAATNLRLQSGVGQSLQPLVFGTGGESQIDFAAITWSDGVFQTELALRPGPLHRIDETERQLSSCPVLFAFDGRHFAFVTDLLGVGGMGTPTAPGVYDIPRPRENLLLPDGLLKEAADASGRLALKITEPMEEVMYLDAARLVAYDLPPGWQMVLDERKAISLPEATGEARFYREERLPIRATDDSGRDVTESLAAADGIAAPPASLDARFIGLTAGHSLRLVFDRSLDAGPGDAMLVADGWIEYPYAQTLFAAWQAGAAYRAPSIDARDANGVWHLLRREFGYPAGMPRRMSLPLGRMPAGTRELRVRTNQEIYWDRLAVAYSAPSPLVARRVLPLTAARLTRSGFAPRKLAAGRRPSYDYDRRTPFWDARYQRGDYTAEGPVAELLTAEDGAVAIVGPGEEIHLEFTGPASALPAGWTRRFVLEARGWCKDMDLYTKDGDTVAPLPGRRSPAAEQLQRRYTTRHESGW